MCSSAGCVSPRLLVRRPAARPPESQDTGARVGSLAGDESSPSGAGVRLAASDFAVAAPGGAGVRLPAIDFARAPRRRNDCPRSEILTPRWTP
jgi:hypothetical protein